MQNKLNINFINKVIRIVLPNLLLIFCTTYFCYSQSNSKNIYFDHYGPQEGFRSSQAIGIGKTSDGFLWIGTDIGLERYDGHTFKTYKHEFGNPNSISGNYIKFLEVDNHDRLWIDADNKLCVFDWKSKIFHHPELPKKSEKRHRYKFHYDKAKDRMWIITNDGIFYNEGKEINIKELIIKQTFNRSFLDAAIDDNDLLWLIGKEGLYRYELETEKLTIFKRDVKKSKDKNPSDFLTLHIDKDYVWLGCWVNGLVRFDKNNHQQKRYAWQDITKFQNGILDINKSGIKGEEHKLWLATTSGIFTFDTKQEFFNSYQSENSFDRNKVNGSGFHFLPVKKDGLWIGTYKGLYKYDEKKQLIGEVALNIDKSYEKREIGKLCILKNKIDSIAYIRYEYADVIKYDLKNNRQIPLPTKLEKYCNISRDIFNIFIDSKSRLWLTSNKDGVVIYDLINDKILQPQRNVLFKNNQTVINVTEDNKGKIYINTFSDFFEYNERTNEIIGINIYDTLATNKNINYVSPSFFDINNNFYFIEYNHKLNKDKLFLYDFSNRKLKQIISKDKSIIPILNKIETIKITKDNVMFITSQLGLVSYDIYKSEFRKYELNAISQIEIGNDKDVWLSNDFGVCKLDSKNEIITKFTFYNSNIGNRPKPIIIKSINSNILYITQNNKLNFIDLSNFSIGNRDTIHLTDISIKNFDEPIASNFANELQLKYFQNEINLKFSIFNFTNSNENIYQYKLNDEVWKTMKDNELSFQELGAGNYKLNVRAYNSFGFLTANSYSLSFEISPPFWRSIWFYFLLLSIFFIIIYLLFKYRENQRLNLEKLRYNIARDLHDDLGSNLSQIKLISEIESLKNQGSKYADITSKLSDVMQNMREIVWSINPKFDHVDDVVNRIQEFAIDTLEPKGINLKFKIDEIPSAMKLSPENRRNFYLIFKEAINNTLKYSHAKNVEFSIIYSNKSLVASLKDDGIGFDNAMISYGNGLRNMKERADAMKAKIDITTNSNGTIIKFVI